MNMIATVATKEKAWQLTDKLFPTDYSRNEPDSLRAGYPIFNTTSTDSKYKGFIASFPSCSTCVPQLPRSHVLQILLSSSIPQFSVSCSCLSLLT